MLPIAVIGAGFSGTMAAIQLARQTGGSRPILVFEKAQSAGPGLAYSTSEPRHLLNVRAANMSAFPDRPEHFESWLAALDPERRKGRLVETQAGVFASRSLYGEYLASLMPIGADSPIREVRAEVVDVKATPKGLRLTTDAGAPVDVAGAVIAAGNFLPDRSKEPRHIRNPWRQDWMLALSDKDRVLIVGSGLTMVDIAIQLRGHGFKGEIVALSRRGLMPQQHVPGRPWPMPSFTAEDKTSPARLARRLRAETRAAAAQGLPWQPVIDSIRPITAALWNGWSEKAQKQFLRHARPWWDIHRHRMAPPVAEQIRAMLEGGQLRVIAGSVKDMRFGPEEALLTYRPRGSRGFESLKARFVIDATGTLPAAAADSLLLHRLTDRGLARFDRHRLGLDVTDHLQVIGAGGVTAPLWALGPIVKGVFWECVAVPDIRVQAEALARIVSRSLESHRV